MDLRKFVSGIYKLAESDSLLAYNRKHHKMRKLIFTYLLFQTGICFGQNVKLDISDYHCKIDDKIYATYQLVNASYSYSRATIVFLTNKATLFELSVKLQNQLKPKQEYTDIWVLGIENFDSKKITETDKKIIDLFLQNIIKYRADNSLPEFTFERLNKEKIFIERSDEVCNYMICKSK